MNNGTGVQPMVIALEDANRGNRNILFIGGRSRVASATSVRFLDADRLVACSLAGQRLYLMRFDVARGTHSIVHAIPTQYRGEHVCSDLLDFDGNDLLIASNCAHDSATLYRVVDDQLLHVKDIPIPDGASWFCHGARFVPGAPDTVCLTCVNGQRNLYFISMATGEILYQFGHDRWRPHDVCFLDSRHMIVLYERGKPTRDPSRWYGAKVCLVSFDLGERVHEFVAEARFPQTHMDCCQVYGGRAYITNQMRDTVIVCRVLDGQLVFERELHGFSFPHGLDVLPASNLLAVTNYGNNTLVLTALPDNPS